MHPHTDALLRHLDGCRGELRHAVDAVPVAQRQVRVGPDRWSVADVLEHLSLVERGVAVLIARRSPSAPTANSPPDIDVGGVVASLDAFLDRTRTAEAPERVRPSGDIDAEAAWDKLSATRERFAETVRSTDPLDLRSVEVPHPLIGPLNLYQWIAFVGVHERRHAAQIAEIGEHVSGGDGSA